MDNVWTNLGNRLETAWKRPARPNSKKPLTRVQTFFKKVYTAS